MDRTKNTDVPDKSGRSVTLSLRTLVTVAIVVVLLVGAGAIGYSLNTRRHTTHRDIASHVIASKRSAHPAAAPLSSSGESTKPEATPATATTTTTPLVAPTTTVPLSSPVAQTGIYVDGGQGTPHYLLALNNGSNGNVSGSVDFLYQDGQTSVVFTFVGTLSGAGTLATLTPVSVPQNNGSASQTPGSIPSQISATLSQGNINLGECTVYLHFVQSEAACGFTFSSSVQ